MPRYCLSATCTNPNCPTRDFHRMKPKMTYRSTDGHEHVIQKLACPSCRNHADVTRIVSVEPGKLVA